MAGYIKGITIEFGANTTKLNKALANVNSRLNKTQAELKQVNRSLKFNPGNTTLLNQKFKLLSQTVSQTEKKLQGLRAMQARLDAKGVDTTSATYRQLQREIIKTENQLKRAEGELRKFGTVGLQQAFAVGNAFKTCGGKIKSAGRTITTTFSVYGAMGIYAGKRLIDMSEAQAQAEVKLTEIYRSRLGVGKKAVQSTIELAKAEQKLGIIGDEVQISGAQQLATFAKYPSTVNTLLPAMNNLLAQQKGVNASQQDAVQLGNLFGKVMQGQTGALKRWGVSFTRAQEEVLKFGTEEEKAAMLAEVVNQNVGDMNKALASTKTGKIKQAKNLIGDLGEDLGTILLPAVADIAKWISKMLPKLEKLIKFLKQHPAIAKFALALAACTAAAGPLLMLFGGLISTIGSLITIASTLGIAIGAIAAPIAIVIAAIAAAIAIGVLLYKNWDTIKAKASAAWTAIKTAITKAVTVIKTAVTTNFNTLKNNVSSIFYGVKSTVSSVWSGIKSKVTSAVSSIKSVVTSGFSAIKSVASSIWNGIKTAITSPITTAASTVKGIINKIKGFFPLKIGKIFSGLKLPSFNVKGGKAPFGLFGKGTKPSISVSWNKKAMNNPYMFNNATLFGAGEAGDEILYGRNSLMNDIMSATGGGEVVARLAAIEAILDYYLPKGQQIVMDNGALIGQVNRGLGLKL